MSAEELIRERIAEQGKTVKGLAAETGFEYELIRRSVNGQRYFKPDELVEVLHALGISVDEIRDAHVWEVGRDDSGTRNAGDSGNGG